MHHPAIPGRWADRGVPLVPGHQGALPEAQRSVLGVFVFPQHWVPWSCRSSCSGPGCRAPATAREQHAEPLQQNQDAEPLQQNRTTYHIKQTVASQKKVSGAGAGRLQAMSDLASGSAAAELIEAANTDSHDDGGLRNLKILANPDDAQNSKAKVPKLALQDKMTADLSDNAAALKKVGKPRACSAHCSSRSLLCDPLSVPTGADVKCVYLCVCMCMYVCVYVCVYVCMCIYIYIYTYIYIHSFISHIHVLVVCMCTLFVCTYSRFLKL